MTIITQKITNAKNNLKNSLITHHGDLKNLEVVNAIEELSRLNPTPAPVENESLLQGNWLLINAPNFPDRQPVEQNRAVYHLGRLAFNMFEPTDLKVAIEKVSQPVFLTDNEREYTHHIVVEFKTIDRAAPRRSRDRNFPELKGIIKNLAICYPVDKDTLQVEFTGGELYPLDTENSQKMQQWLSIFGEGNSSQISIQDRFNSWIVKFMFGISQPTSLDTQTGKRSFIMKRSPKGLLKVLYLDEELRITKGNKETVLVCQRQ